MPNVTDLSAIVGSQWSDNNSVFMYCIYDGTDYRVSMSALQEKVARRGGAMRIMTVAQTIAQNTDTLLTFGSAAYEDGAGWLDTNSTTCIFAPRPMLLQLGTAVRWQANDSGCRQRILPSNSLDTGKRWSTTLRWHQGTAAMLTYTYPYAASSGECFTVRVHQEDQTSKGIFADQTTFWATPLAYL